MNALITVAAIALLFGIGIAWKQSRAKKCPSHNRLAGRVAVALAIVCFATAIALVLLATAPF